MALLGPDLQLDDATHDLVFVNGALQLRVDVAQKIKIRLLFVRGEWFLDIEEGLPYLQQIFVKSPNLDLLRSVYRSEIMNTLGVLDVRTIELTYETTTRKLSVSWSADTDQGEVDGTIQT